MALSFIGFERTSTHYIVMGIIIGVYFTITVISIYTNWDSCSHWLCKKKNFILNKLKSTARGNDG